jgi:hypothetical protein
MNRLAVCGMKRQSLSKPDFCHPTLRDRVSRMGVRAALWTAARPNPSHASLQVTRHVFSRSRLKGGGGVPSTRLIHDFKLTTATKPCAAERTRAGGHSGQRRRECSPPERLRKPLALRNPKPQRHGSIRIESRMARISATSFRGEFGDQFASIIRRVECRA